MLRVTTLLLLSVATACGEPARSPTVVPDPLPAADPTADSAATAPRPEPPAPAPTSDPAATADGAIDEIVFRFHDASVPPQYHRSYTIVATAKSIRKTVDSYGDVISDESAALTRAEFDALVAALKTHTIKVVPDAAASLGCSGGTARSLKLLHQGAPILEGRLERCGAKDTGNLAGDLDAFVAELAKRAPSTLKRDP